MPTKTLSVTAALLLFGATTAAAGCNWGKDAMAYTPVDTEKLAASVETASMPVDAWLVKYLENWQQA